MRTLQEQKIYQRKHYLLNSETYKTNAKRWYALNKQRKIKTITEWQKKHPLQRSSRSIVSNALKNGALKKLPCYMCGAIEVSAHHNDYNKPLEVIWLCKECHSKLHRMNFIVS